jgi:RNA polymerase sigma factor (sigma-70 family)
MADPTERPDSVLAALEQRHRIEEAIHRIDARCREMLRLLYFSDTQVSYRTVAKSIGVAENSIGSLKTRCLEKLRKLLEARA